MTPSAEALELHRRACEAGEPGYLDPQSGLFVQTSHGLRVRGYCCAEGCRHCPWSLDTQEAAGRRPGPAWPWPVASADSVDNSGPER